MKVQKDMDLEDLAREIPQAIGWLTRRNVICIQCGTPLWKTVGEAIHDAGYEKVDAMIEELNRSLENEEH